MIRHVLRPRISIRPFGLCEPVFLPYRTLIAAPSSNSGPLMTRRSDRELPEIPSSYSRWLKTLPIFLAILGASTVAIFNYQKASSSIVNATLYALRTSPRAREVLGDEIYFRDKFPWIWGEMNQLHGRIDIKFGVKGNKAKGRMRFKSVRQTRMGHFETQEWSLELEDGEVIQLLQEERADPFLNTKLQAEVKGSDEVSAQNGEL